MIMISVIIPCFNSEKTIEDTLKSLEKQTIKSFEVICINDGSTDTTLEKLVAFQQKKTINLNIINQMNLGVSSARNKGIGLSKGKVILFLDADDMYCNSFLEMVFKSFEKGYDTVFGLSTSDIEKFHKKSIIHYQVHTQLETQNLFMRRKDLYHMPVFSYKADIIKKNDIYFSAGLKYGEDWEFTTKYLDFCDKCLEVYIPILFRRIINTSAMHRITYDQIDAIKSATRTEKWLKEHNSIFYFDFSQYMYHRAVFSVAHNFTKYRARKLYFRLIKEYDVKTSMHMLVIDSNVGIKIRLAAMSFIISKYVFYYITGRL